MDTLYPVGPSSVPANLTAPSATYKRHAWLAMAGLLVFVGFYLALLGWFAWTAYRLIGALAAGTSDNPLAAAGVGICAAFLALFMAKALIFIKRGAQSDDIELKPADQPRLFAFLHRLADEAGAPRPHRVYVSPRVNAAVFYDLSIANLIFPSRKNLEIGLALVNVLNLGELKAVLAHEFGHFAQRTMAVGRWVYIAQQIASHIIAKRDAFDKFLLGLSQVDLRVAWIGWLLRLIVWSIRSLVELIFRIVVLAQRALSREMEYQADLVAASLTGSDALVNALHKLHAADDAWDRAVNFGSTEIGQKRTVRDLFAVQTRIIEKMRVILADPLYGAAPEVPVTAPDRHRVFRNELAQPPQMWSTHPANADREQNVKRQYIAAPVDTRPAWVLFDRADDLRSTMSAGVYTGELPPAVDIDVSLRHLDADYARPNLDRRYRGSFLGRSIVRHVASVNDLYSAVAENEDLPARIAALYGDDHDRDLDRLRELTQEKQTLAGLQAGYLTAPGGVVRWRGSQLARRELPRVLKELEQEIAPVMQSIHAHDRRCRSLHLAAAQRLGGGWEDYLRGMAAALHYADHALADLRDAQGFFANTYGVVTADGNVSATELTRLLQACNVLQSTLSAIYHAAGRVQLGAGLLGRMRVASWAEALGEFKLPPATKDNINDWMRVIDGWVNATAASLAGLRDAALELLVSAEHHVAQAIAADAAVEAAPEASRLDIQYVTLLPGSERKRQQKLGWWDRFQTADGWMASIARFGIAGGIVGSVLFLGGSVGYSMLHIYNGLERTVLVRVDDFSTKVAAHSHDSVALTRGGMHRIEALTEGGRTIESFAPDTTDFGAQFVYNVAGAAVLIQSTATYGNATEVPDVNLGAQRWLTTGAEHVFTEAPDSISTKSGGATRAVLMALSDMSPGQLLSGLDVSAQPAVIRAHALWDEINTPHVVEWLGRAADLEGFDDIVAKRQLRSPDEVVSLRAEQDAAEGEAHQRVCEKHQAMSAANPKSGDLRYLALRCTEDGPDQRAAFLAAMQQWPDNAWLEFAAAHALAETLQWREAAVHMQHATDRLPAVADWARVDLARLIRMSPGPDVAEIGELANQSGYLAQYLAMESGQGLDEASGLLAYAQLGHGEFDAALAEAAKNAGHRDEIVLLVAASEGATADQVEAGLGATISTELNDTTVWPALALAMRQAVDVAPWLERARTASDEDDAEMIWSFLQSVHAGTPTRQAETLLGAMGPRERGIAYASAVVLLGDRSPDVWRDGAKRLLFGFEHPFFR
jgi:Zn-dependent protease with chaperone function